MRDLSLSVLDIVQNSISAKAHLIKIIINETHDNNTLYLTVSDDGRGMTENEAKNADNPFFTTRKERSVGLGLSLLKMAVDKTGGIFEINSRVGEGTQIKCLFNTDNIDMIPIGDMSKTIALLVCCNPNIDFVYERCADEKAFVFDTRGIKIILGAVCINNSEVIKWVLEYLQEQEIILSGGAISNENT